MRAVALQWIEHERGWGAKPDGITFSASMEEARKEEADHLAKHHKSPVAPEWYTQPEYSCLVEMSEELFKTLEPNMHSTFPEGVMQVTDWTAF